MNTKEKIDHAIKILEAFKEGEKIEYRYSYTYCVKELYPYEEDRWEDLLTTPLDFIHYDYRIKPKEKTSIPATQEELKDIESVIFLKDKKDKDIYSFMSSEVKTMGFKDKTVWYKFNPHTKCWEDWSEE